MGWAYRIISSSIGKKELMALTGFCFLAFLVVHLGGNLTIYGGAEEFRAYAYKLHSLEPFLYVFEIGLLGLGIIHVASGALLFVQNLRARPEKYAVKRNAGGMTLSSRFMPYTGFIILIFLVVHLSTFTFADKADVDIAILVDKAFESPLYSAFYVFVMAVLFLHVRHGFWSAFQTIGANHPKYMPAIELVGVAAAIVFALGYASLPVYVYLKGLTG